MIQERNAKPYVISCHLIMSAWEKVRSNRGSAGIDCVGIEDFESNLKPCLYKVWNSMSSGSYFPRAVKLVDIPKSNCGKRPLGIPTVEDPVAQMAVGPVLANLFLHYVFDKWMTLYHPLIRFERYADDSVCHCRRYEEAERLHESISCRFASSSLSLNLEKTKIVYSKSNRLDYLVVSFDSLGYTFCSRSYRSRKGNVFTGFVPAIGKKSKQRLNEYIRSWDFRPYPCLRLEQIAACINPIVYGWIHYYGKYNPSILKRYLDYLNWYLARWARRKYKRFHGNANKAYYWLSGIAQREPFMFVHWEWGVIPGMKKLHSG